MRFKKFLIGGLLLSTLIGCSDVEPSIKEVETKESEKEKRALKRKEASKNQSHRVEAEVIRVVDGDTIEVVYKGKEEDLRLLLIDTPETVHPRKPVEPFGPEASAFAKKVLEGKTVQLQTGSEARDKYGRLLAYVWIGDTTYQEMVLRKGFATTAYLYNDLTRVDELHKAQNVAKKRGIGVWSIPGYAHVNHDHGYHYKDDKSEPEETNQVTPSKLKYDPNGPDRDCGDFDSSQQAQEFMENSGPGDPHRLDGNDNDGLACESL